MEGTLQTEAKIINAGVDYLTAVAMGEHDRICLGAFGSKIMGDEKRLGNDVSLWSMMGYEGFRCGPIQFGERHDSTILRLSSHAAQEHWWEAYQRSSRVTRIDLEVTVRIPGNPALEVLKQHKAVKRFWAGRRDGPTITLWTSDDGGTTLYLGKRESHVYLRAYNKESESKDPYYKGCVRFEGEFKSRGAQYALDNVLSGEAVATMIARFLHELFTERGCLLPFAAKGLKAQAGALHRSATSDEKKLQWFRNGVRPSVERLIESGKLVHVLEALGLSEFVAPVSNGPHETATNDSKQEIDHD